MHHLVVTAVLMLSTVGSAACQKSTPASKSTAGAVAAQTQTAQPVTPAADQPPAPTEAKPVPAELPAVVARVNGQDIARDELERAVKGLESQRGPIPAQSRNEVYRGMLDQLVAYQLLRQETKTRNLAVTDADVNSRLETIKKQFPSEDAFKQALAIQGMTVEKLREQARGDLGVNRLLETEVGPQVKVQETDVKTFYDANPDKFRQGESVRANHILIAVPEKADAAAKQKARAEAEAVLAKLKAGGDFAALAKEHSQDPGSAGNGGDLNYFGSGQMVPAFEKTAFALKPGELSGIVETQFGFHIIKMTDRKPARSVPLEEVSARINEFLTQQQRQDKTMAFIDQLKAKAKVEILI